MLDNKRAIKLLRGSEPVNNEEREWLKLYNEAAEQRKKEREDFQRRLHAARKEYKELFNKYAPLEYKKGGLFTTKRFKRIERHVERKIEKKLCKMELDTNADVFYNFYELKHKMLKEKYNINWYMFSKQDLPKEYHDKVKAIEEKYNIESSLFYTGD